MNDLKSNISDNSRRIARNTLLLYIRLLVLLPVGLYTSRVILQTLGESDVGIYNVVGGVVTMFGFLNAAMTGVSQRYITFALGKGDSAESRKVFSTVTFMHIAIALTVLIVGEVLGLWLLHHKMVIPPDRMNAAFWVFQASMASLVIMIISVPYNGAVIAHEKMEAFAYISVFDAFAKLATAFFVRFIPFDRLVLYALLIMLIQMIDRLVYRWYCLRRFDECRISREFDRSLFREMLGFGGWNMFGSLASVGMTQGVNVLLNMFFGTAVNAARGFAVQIENCVSGFVGSIQTAMNPQIIKNYAGEKYRRMHELMWCSSRYSFFLLLIIVLPLLLKADYVVALWLKDPPEHTAAFARIILLTSLINSMSGSVNTGSQATGDVRKVQVIVGSVLLMIVPVAYVFLKLGASPESVFCVTLAITLLAQIIRLVIVCPMVRMKIMDYVRNVYLPVTGVFLPTLALGWLIARLFPEDNIMNLLIVVLMSVTMTCIVIYAIGLNREEKSVIKAKILKKWDAGKEK